MKLEDESGSGLADRGREAAVNQFESRIFPSLERRGGRDQRERPGWLVSGKNHPGCASEERGHYLEARSRPSLERRDISSIPIHSYLL